MLTHGFEGQRCSSLATLHVLYRRGWSPAEDTLLRWVKLAERTAGWESTDQSSSQESPLCSACGCPSKCALPRTPFSSVAAAAVWWEGLMQSSTIRTWHEDLVFGPTLGKTVFSEREKQQLVTCQMAVTLNLSKGWKLAYDQREGSW